MEFKTQITKKYSGNTYAYIEISLNTCRNTPDFMCDLELFSKLQSQFVYYIVLRTLMVGIQPHRVMSIHKTTSLPFTCTYLLSQ